MSQMIPDSFNALFVQVDTDKNTASSLRRFYAWLEATKQDWFTADLLAYRDYLLHTASSAHGGQLSRSTIKKHMERVRGRYRDLLHSNNVRDMLQRAYDALPKNHPHRADFSKFEFTQEALVRLSNNTQYERMPVKVIEVRDYADSDFHWLTPDQIDTLLEQPSRKKLIGYRDVALISLAYCCGLREAELCAVTVEDLRERYKGVPALRVRQGKGSVQRMVVYGDMAEYLIHVDEWLELSGIDNGALFRATDKTGKQVIHDSLTPRAFAYRLAKYRADDLVVTPHDLRRSYAKNLYDAGMPLEAIRQQMGHKKIETTLWYIGLLDAADRTPRLSE